MTYSEISYLYSVADQRMYKETQNSTDTTREYDLKNIGIARIECRRNVDLQSNMWTCYVNGADKVVKITPFENQQPKNIGSEIASTLNDTLIASFYLYELPIHIGIGNTRVVYSAEIQYATYVAYSIDYACDYILTENRILT